MIQPSKVWELFEVNFDRGKLFWKKPPSNHQRLLGAEAGTMRLSGSGKPYWHIKIEGVAYKRANLIYAAFYGVWPTPMVDHRNGDSLDDRPANLRRATVLQNAWNHKRRARRIDLPMGVRATESGRFEARIGHMGKQHHLGAYATPEEAAAVYRAKREELFGEFA